MKWFLISREKRNKVSELTDEDAGKLFKMIFAYEDGEDIDMTGEVGMAFRFGFQDDLDKNRKSYDKRCEVNRANGQKGGRPKAEEKEDLFEEFWKAYPRHDARASAEKAFKKISPTLLRETILPDLDQRKRSEQWRDKKFIPHASTYLNQRRWEDEIIKSKRQNYEQREVNDSDFASGFYLDLNQEI